MSLRRTTAKGATSTRLRYICPRCEVRTLKRLARNGFQGYLPSQRPAFRAPSAQNAVSLSHFSTATSLTALEPSPSTSPSSSIDDILELHTALSHPQEGHDATFKRDSIRQQLKAWSVNNEQEKKEQTPETIPAEGRILSLPLSYFMPEPEFNAASEFEEDPGLAQDEGEEWDESIDSGHITAPGSLLMLFPKGYTRTQFAVCLGSLGFGTLFLLRSGEWLLFRPRTRVTLVTPNFASEEEVAEILQYLPKRPIERENLPGSPKSIDWKGDVVAGASNPMVQRMNALANDVLRFQRDNIELLDSLYEGNAHDTDFVSLPFRQLIHKVAGTSPSHAAQWAIYMAVLKDTTRMLLCDSGDGFNQTMTVVMVPQQLMRRLDTVVGWAREYQDAAAQAAMGNDVSRLLRDSPITSFIEKARRSILASRKIRSPTTTGSLGPSKHQKFSNEGLIATQPTGETFSETDKMIVDFIWNTYCRTPAPMKITRHHSSASLILRAIGAYPKMVLGSNVGELFLQEIGAMAPFGRHHFNQVQVPFPGRKGSEEITRMHTAAMELSNELGFSLETSTVPLEDSLYDIRKDFRDLEAISIDSASTVVVDDAISLESYKENPKCHWIHVHIAHPTAFFGSDHLFARLARAQIAATYSALQNNMMLPPPVAIVMGLRNGSAALTVSTLLNEDGDVLDIRIQASKLNKVVHLQRVAVFRSLERHAPEQAYMVVGADPKARPEPFEEPTTETLKEVNKRLPTLKKIDALLGARVLARRRENPNWLDDWRMDYIQKVKISGNEGLLPTRLHQSYHYLGDPTIHVTAHRFLRSDKVSSDFRTKNRDLVEEAMVLCSESAGRWARDRNIPSIYGGAIFHPEYPAARINKLGKDQPYSRPRYFESLTPVYRPGSNTHHSMKITSPLRRFGDMLVQWNINAYLRAEAEGTVEPGAPLPNDMQLPIPRQAMQDYLDNDTWKAIKMQRLEQKTVAEHATQALFRAFHFGEAKLPEVWDFKVAVRMNLRVGEGHAEQSGLIGILQPFLIRGHALKSEEGWENDVAAGQYLPVKIELVDPMTPLVYVRAVGPASDTYTQKDPISIWSLEGKPEALEGVESGSEPEAQAQAEGEGAAAVG